MKFYIEIERHDATVIALETEAVSAHEAVRLASAFIRGGQWNTPGASAWTITGVGKRKGRGLTYTVLA